MSTNEIVCPHCAKAFKIDEAGYADILKQVRDHTFETEMAERLKLAEQDKQTAVELARSQAANDAQSSAAEKDAEIQQLRAKLSSVATEKELAVTQAIAAVEKTRDSDVQARDAEIATLKSKLASNETEQTLAITQAVGAIEKERDRLKGDLEQQKLRQEVSEQAMKDKYETQIKDRDAAIERLKDMKARLSTKMLGETLEQHCENQFNQIRATAFPQAYFEKDNDASSGSKVD